MTLARMSVSATIMVPSWTCHHSPQADLSPTSPARRVDCPPLSGIAREEIADPRVEWVIADGGDWLTAAVTREDR